MKLLRFLGSKIFWINIAVIIVLTVSLGFGVGSFLNTYTNQDQKIEVPNLRGLSIDEVKVVLEDLKLRHEILEIGSYRPEIAKGAVLEQEPISGQVVKEKRKIYVTINPKGYAMSIIPEFYGKTKKEIEQVIVNSGFLIGSYEEVEDIGTVIRGLKHNEEELSAGDKIPKMSVIDIVIGNGMRSQLPVNDSIPEVVNF